jgi:hypothetical protein
VSVDAILSVMSAPPPPPKTPEQIRAEVKADPNTARIAKALGVPLDEYVERVVHYAVNPNDEPEIEVLPDEALKEQGYEPPSYEEMVDFVVDQVETLSGLKRARSGYAEAGEEPVDLGGKPAESEEELPEGSPELLEELKRRRGGGGSF